MNGQEKKRFKPSRFGSRNPRPQEQPRVRGAATFVPKIPKTHRERRRMLKATLHRLSRAVRTPCAILIEADPDTIINLVRTHFDNRRASGVGEALRLAKKIVRLRLWTQEQNSDKQT